MGPVDKKKQPTSRKGKAVETEEKQSRSRIITSLNDADILLGRGAPVQRREANRRFRELVWAHKPAYDATGKHSVKDKISRQILDVLAERGGRFVRRIETAEERRTLGVPGISEAWVVINEDLAREKCKQALRDAVPPCTERKSAAKSRRTKKRKSDSSADDASPSQRKGAPSAACSKMICSAIRPRDSPRSDSKNGDISVARAAGTPQMISSSTMSQEQQQYSFDDDELSFRRKHPSLRKRDLLRRRHQQKQKQFHSVKPAKASPVQKTAKQGNAPETKRQNHNDDQSSSSLSASSSFSKEDNDTKLRAVEDRT